MVRYLIEKPQVFCGGTLFIQKLRYTYDKLLMFIETNK